MPDSITDQNETAKSIRDIFQEIRQDTGLSTVERGARFEKISKIFLENDALMKDQYSQVWMWRDWQKEHEDLGFPSTDSGVDLVAENQDQPGTYTAIQCKFFDPKNSVTKEAMNSFLSLSANRTFTKRVLITTSEKDIQKKSNPTLDEKPFKILRTIDFERSDIDWDTLQKRKIAKKPPKTLRPHQEEALKSALNHFHPKGGTTGNDQRARITMACGTGKTLLSLRIAEKFANIYNGKANGRNGKDPYMTLYMVPSLALMSQVIRDWKNDCMQEFSALSVCSDTATGRRSNADDNLLMDVRDLAFNATTDAETFGGHMAQISSDKECKHIVVFCTYQSIQTLKEAQGLFSGIEFDLIFCDEAHRTTGATQLGKEHKDFVKIHHNEHVKGKRRIYMTATPKIYGENAKKQAQDLSVQVSSMDNEDIYGPEIYKLSFDEAVRKKLLSDYKVMILSIDREKMIAAEHAIRNSITEDMDEVDIGDFGRMVGCWKALKKEGIENGKTIQTAMAFSNKIKESEIFARHFPSIVENYGNLINNSDLDTELEADHIDGNHSNAERNEKLHWLQEKSESSQNCKILSNVKCLSEGVDVPALDAIMFLKPKQSQIDVIQSVGRVMRKAKGKEIGWVILPVVATSEDQTQQAISKNKEYKIVWQILNALRSHDQSMDQIINKIDLGETVRDKIRWHDATRGDKIGIGKGTEKEEPEYKEPEQLRLFLGDMPPPLKAALVEKCGTRGYWKNWAADIADIANIHIQRITEALKEENTPEQKAFQAFLEEIRDDLNPEISKEQAIEMLAQHIITGPVFDALFQGNHRFTSQNSISKAMETTLALIDKQNIAVEQRSLDSFYEDVRLKAQGIENLESRQKLIKDLYGDFFKDAFPKTTEKFGIFYTPIEIVDFMIHSVQHVLQKEFDTNLSQRGVDIIDPFTGTGTFITRLIQSGLLGKNLEHKYLNEIHANEVMLLAYYIACVNIESVFHAETKKDVAEYIPFPGAVLTDTLQLAEQDQDMIANLMPDNSGRRKRQKKRPIKVIIGNPPYSARQRSENDNAANTNYPILNHRIKETYLSFSSSNSKTSMYDTYIKSLRWASDRLEFENQGEGIIAYITNAGFIRNKTTAGLRKSLKDEFDHIYIFDLRGNFRIKGDQKTTEGENVFDIKTPVAITILVKKTPKDSGRDGNIHYYKYNDGMKRDEKLKFLKENLHIGNIQFGEISPNKQHSWLSQGDEQFQDFLPMEYPKKSQENSIFTFSSSGILSGRRPYTINFSKEKILSNVSRSIDFYNHEIIRVNANTAVEAENRISKDPAKIIWNDADYSQIAKKISKTLDHSEMAIIQSRPFMRTWAYTAKDFNSRTYKSSSLFPKTERRSELPNIAITIANPSHSNEFSVTITEETPDLHLLGGAKNFPLYKYNITTGHRTEGAGLAGSSVTHQPEGPGLVSSKNNNPTLFDIDVIQEQPCREYAVSKKALNAWRITYSNEKITEEDLFYHIYGILHSHDYRKRYRENLHSSYPRIPILEKYEDFVVFSQAGRDLAGIHLKYEEAEMYQADLKGDQHNPENPREFYHITKMKFPEKGNFTKVQYNSNVIIENIPEKAWEYKLDGDSALNWVMKLQQIKTDKDTGIVNDPNDWANDTMNNPRYPLELFLRVITVSMKTLEIMESLPELKIRKE